MALRFAWRCFSCSPPARLRMALIRWRKPCPRKIGAPLIKRTLRMLLVKNGRVLDPASKTDADMDVLLDGETIREVAPAGKSAAPQNVEIFDATGLIVVPGFIDIHAHLR